MDLDISARYWNYAIPSLFSEWYYGAAPYTYFQEVANQVQLVASHINIRLSKTSISKTCWTSNVVPGMKKGTG